MTILTSYQRRCWLCLSEISDDVQRGRGHICPTCLGMEKELAELAKPASIKSCPECGTALETCPYTDYRSRYWYWCSNCDDYWHEDDLAAMSEQAAQHADWLDELRTIASLRAEL